MRKHFHHVRLWGMSQNKSFGLPRTEYLLCTFLQLSSSQQLRTNRATLWCVTPVVLENKGGWW